MENRAHPGCRLHGDHDCGRIYLLGPPGSRWRPPHPLASLARPERGVATGGRHEGAGAPEPGRTRLGAARNRAKRISGILRTRRKVVPAHTLDTDRGLTVAECA